ncbi:hypothetical protein THASP1DRAFT_30256, partial [Thamnocephalis sphaerospora]
MTITTTTTTTTQPPLIRPATLETPLAQFNQRLQRFVRYNRRQDFWNTIENMKAEKLEFDATTWDAIATMYANWNEWGSVKATLEERRLAKFPATAATYTALFEANVARYAPDHCEMLMENMNIDMVAMNSTIYDKIIFARARTEPEHALRTLQEMGARGLTPFTSSYASVARAFSHTKEPNVALAVLREGERRGQVPTSSYFDVLESSADGDYMEGVLYCWKALLANKLNVHEGACLKVLRAAAVSGNSELASEVLRHLSTQGYKCGVQHFTPLFEALVKSGDMAAFGVLDLMNETGLPIDSGVVSAWTARLSGSIEALDRGFRLLERLHEPSETGVPGKPIHIALFNSVLTACINLRDAERAAETFQAAGRLGVTPNTDS